MSLSSNHPVLHGLPVPVDTAPITTLGQAPTAQVITLNPPAKSVRTRCKEEGINLQLLLDILRHQRPGKTSFEQAFCDEFINSTHEMQEDGFGNFWCQIGDAPTTMWSCHTDTVATKPGMQNVEWRGDVLWLNQGKPGMCLGADDGAGIWLMLQMIEAKKPGLYVFHREEETGGIGSSWIVKNTPQLVSGIKRAIAFDRKDTTSVITHQRSQRCCSDTFGQALADALNLHPGMEYKLDRGGVFTDTANYDGLVPECTNLSTGYYKEHGPKEHLDVAHLVNLRAALLGTDFEILPTERDPNTVEYDDDWGRSTYGGYGRGHYGYSRNFRREETESERMATVIRNRAYTLANLFEAKGLTAKDINEMCEEYWSSKGSTLLPTDDAATADADLAGDPDEIEEEEEVTIGLECLECEQVATPWGSAEFQNGDRCWECGSTKTETLELDKHGQILR